MDQDTVIFDLDGTLALIDHRLHHVQRQPYDCPDCKMVKPGEPFDCKRCQNTRRLVKQPSATDWRLFYAACDNDTPNEWVIELTRLYSEHYNVVILSGRSEEVFSKTVQWLDDHRVHYDTLLMRPQQDTSPDGELKSRWLEELGLAPERVAAVFDDRDKMVKMWREKGYRCAQVAPGNF